MLSEMTLRGELVEVYDTDLRHSIEFDNEGDFEEGDLFAYGKIRVPSAPYETYFEEQAGWMN